MARKGESYQQVPTLWHNGWGYPCRVMRRRKGQTRWQNAGHDILTMASAMRWARLANQGRAMVRRDVNKEAMVQMGIIPRPERAMWAQARTSTMAGQP